jgi:hypothetical protein
LPVRIKTPVRVMDSDFNRIVVMDNFALMQIVGNVRMGSENVS